MKQTEVLVRTLEPEDGCVLTQADENIPVTGRILATEITLGIGDSPDNWREISAEEAEQIRAEQEQARKELEERQRQAEEMQRNRDPTN